jgi:hypothetical protein
MRYLLFAVVLLALSAMVFGQATPAPGSAATASPAPAAHGMDNEMMQQHMQEMKAQLDSIRAKIESMKTNLGKVKDPSAKQVLQTDIDLWGTMASHMEAMQRTMSAPNHGAGMAMHHEGGCPCCAGMMSGEAKADDHAMGCCGGGKCMRSKPGTPISPETPAPPAN